MATIGQIYYNVDIPYYEMPQSTNGIKEKIYVGLIGQDETWTRLSIQAPPGTQFYLNGNLIMIGRTGIYELLPEVEATSLKFVRPSNVKYDETQTNTAIQDGLQILYNAETTKIESTVTNAGDQEGEEKLLIAEDNAIKVNSNLNPTLLIDDVTTLQTRWGDHVEALKTYVENAELGIAYYSNGIKGIYKLDNENLYELSNVIIDYISKSSNDE